MPNLYLSQARSSIHILRQTKSRNSSLAHSFFPHKGKRERIGPQLHTLRHFSPDTDRAHDA